MKSMGFARLIAAVSLIAIFLAIALGNYTHAAAIFVAGSFAVEAVRPVRVVNALFAYTGTTLAEIFIPSVYDSIMPNDRPDTLAFSQAGVATTNPLLTAAAQSGTASVETPLWNDLDATSAPNLSDDTDTLATPGKVDTDSFRARNAYLNKGWGAADLAVEMAGATPGNGDPMTRIRNRTGAYWNYQFQDRIIKTCVGVWKANVAQDSSDMVYDISQETTVGLSDSNKIGVDAVIEAVFTMGDKFENIALIAMHSLKYKELVKQQQIVTVQDAVNSLSFPTYLGKRVVIDDGLPIIAGTTSGFRYLSVLFGAGAIGYGEGTPKTPSELERITRGGNGGGLENLFERKTWLIHPWGFDWTDASRAGKSATPAELATAANWDRVLPRKNIKMAFLVTN